ncbi:hypothetical protein ACHAPE_006133 [Trichoderma viride]
MRDTHMPRMTRIEPYQFPTREELLLTGLPSVKHCGTPTYERLTSESLKPIRLCIPAALAGNSFHGTSDSLGEDQSTIKSLVKGLDGHPRIITSEKVECGRFWMLDLASVASDSAVLRSLHKAVASDRNRTQLVVTEDLLNEDQIEELMLQVTSRIPGIDPTMRLLVLPRMLDGTAMPRMINMDLYQTPTPQQFKTGLLLILLCENPHYQHLDTMHPEPVPCMRQTPISQFAPNL